MLVKLWVLFWKVFLCFLERWKVDFLGICLFRNRCEAGFLLVKLLSLFSHHLVAIKWLVNLRDGVFRPYNSHSMHGLLIRRSSSLYNRRRQIRVVFQLKVFFRLIKTWRIVSGHFSFLLINLLVLLDRICFRKFLRRKLGYSVLSVRLLYRLIVRHVLFIPISWHERLLEFPLVVSYRSLLLEYLVIFLQRLRSHIRILFFW